VDPGGRTVPLWRSGRDDVRVTALGVLGPLLLEGDAGPVRIGSARQRRLLAALVAHLGRAVDVARLVDLVWGDDVPADPAGAVQTNVARLRRLLPRGIRITTTPEGYRLEADRAVVDVTAFTDHLAAAAAVDDPTARANLLGAALALWRGCPYTELDHPALVPEVARLAELRAAATEQHAEALLAAGRVPEAVAELEALVAAEPLREGAVAVLMGALVAAGRQGDALAAFARLRTHLADELGLDPSPQLRELERRILCQELPAATSTTSPVPPAVSRRPRVPISSFIGRERAVAYVDELLGRHRVVTLCGPGGVGKTRLALHVAAAVADRYADGVVLVEFGEGGPDDVEPVLAAALRMSDAGGPASGPGFADRVVALLAAHDRLLVLDNCEHVADEVAVLAETICAGAAGVDLLVTSREPLRIDGERVVGVEPLTPDDAAALLIDRMRAAEPDPEGPGRVAPELVAEVCRRLDGLPLALELAAARAVSLGLCGLLRELDEPFPVLRGGRRTAAARHRSLRDVVAWSYGLLDEPQRTLFERLSVFAGPVEHAAVEAVCGDAAALPDLVDRSLVVRRPGDPPTFGMLETLRAFGRSRIAAGPSAECLRARHATWAARLAVEISTARRGPGEAAALRRFDVHLADLRRAHAWLCANGPLDELLRLTVPIAELAYLRGRADLVVLLEDTLRAAGVRDGAAPVGHPLLARLLGYHAHTLWQRGDLAASECQARRAMATAAAAREPTAARDGHEALANVHAFRGDLAAGLRHARLARELAAAAGDVDIEVMALADLCIQSAYAGHHADSVRHEAEMADLVGRAGFQTGRALLAYVRGECRAERGDPDAERHLEEAVALAEECGLTFAAGVARHTLLTSAARSAADPAEALASFAPLIDHWHGFGSWTQLWMAVRALAETLSRLGRHQEATLLIGALSASPRASRVFGADSTRLAAAEATARAALGAAFEVRRAEGAALGDAAAIAVARRLTRAVSPGRPADGPRSAPTSPARGWAARDVAQAG
jgi:predicted ATPase/DNA-binding SARP family transcriptional activator